MNVPAMRTGHTRPRRSGKSTIAQARELQQPRERSAPSIRMQVS